MAERRPQCHLLSSVDVGGCGVVVKENALELSLFMVIELDLYIHIYFNASVGSL